MKEFSKVALIGCGYWGKNLCRNFHALGALKRVIDETESGQKNASEVTSGLAISSSFEDALSDPEISAVALATPAETHKELSIRAMRAGKDVFVEKPMALTLEDAEDMRAVAQNEDKIIMVGHLLEYHPAVLKLRELIDSDELGKINYIYSNRLNFGKVRTEENALWSFAPHDVAVILRLMGRTPKQISATGGSYLTEGIEDTVISAMKFDDQTRAHIFVSWLHPFKEQRLVVVGDKKMASFDDVAPFGQKLALYPNTVKFEGGTPQLKKGDAQYIEHDEKEPLREECRHFLHCITSRHQPLTNAESGIDVLRVLHACQSSIEKGGLPVNF